jgi:NAD dependent epimerase/dehydratase family enzyme
MSSQWLSEQGLLLIVVVYMEHSYMLTSSVNFDKSSPVQQTTLSHTLRGRLHPFWWKAPSIAPYAAQVAKIQVTRLSYVYSSF